MQKKMLLLLTLIAAFGLSSSVFARLDVPNHSFESGTMPGSPGYGDVQGWNVDPPRSEGGGLGLNGSGIVDFSGNRPIPDGSRVVFLQHAGIVYTTVTGFVKDKQYNLCYFENGRLNAQIGNCSNLAVQIGPTLKGEDNITIVPEHAVTVTPEGVPYTYTASSAFTAPASGPMVLQFVHTKQIPTSDSTLLLDAVYIFEAGEPSVLIGLPSSMKFYSAAAAKTATEQSITVSCVGVSPATVNTVTFSGTNSSNFRLVEKPSAAITPGTTATLKISFTPTSGKPGKYSATMKVSGTMGDIMVDLNATVTPGVPIYNSSFEVDPRPSSGAGYINAPPAGWSGGNAAINTVSGPFTAGELIPDGEQVLVMQNQLTLTTREEYGIPVDYGVTYYLHFFEAGRNGNTPIGKVQIIGEGYNEIVPEHTVSVVGPGNPFHLMSKEFEADSDIIYLEISQVAPPDNTVFYDAFTIVKKGDPGYILGLPSSLTLPPTVIGEAPATKSIRIFNIGGSVSNTAFTLSGTDASQFAVSAASSPIDAGKYYDVTVSYTPTKTGEANAVLTAKAGDVELTMAISSIGVVSGNVVVLNPSFEEGALLGFPGYGPIDGWEVSGGNCGVNDWNTTRAQSLNMSWVGMGPTFFDNGAVPNGNRAAFIQGSNHIQQTIAGFEAGQRYEIKIWVNRRRSNSDGHDEVPANYYCTMSSGATVIDLFGTTSANHGTVMSSDPEVGIFETPFKELHDTFTAPVSGSMTFRILQTQPMLGDVAADVSLLLDNLLLYKEGGTPNSAQTWAIFE